VSVTRADRSLGALRPVALTLSFALLLLVAAAGPSAAKPGLGPRGWAPGDLPISLSSAVVTAVLWTAYLLGAAGVAATDPSVSRVDMCFLFPWTSDGCRGEALLCLTRPKDRNGCSKREPEIPDSLRRY